MWHCSVGESWNVVRPPTAWACLPGAPEPGPNTIIQALCGTTTNEVRKLTEPAFQAYQQVLKRQLPVALARPPRCPPRRQHVSRQAPLPPEQLDRHAHCHERRPERQALTVRNCSSPRCAQRRVARVEEAPEVETEPQAEGAVLASGAGGKRGAARTLGEPSVPFREVVMPLWCLDLQTVCRSR